MGLTGAGSECALGAGSPCIQASGAKTMTNHHSYACTCRFLDTRVQGPHWCCRLEGWSAELWRGSRFTSIAARSVQALQQYECRKGIRATSSLTKED
jgi:hypothetical protein